MERPWANGLARLLADRRVLKKGELAELAGVKAGTVSAVANSPKPPDVATLQKLAAGFTAFDRREDPSAPAVEMWEFFVSDEQAAMLHSADVAKRAAIRQQEQDPSIKLAKALTENPALVSVMMKLVENASTSNQPAAPAVNSDSTEHPPAAANVDTEPARGRLRYRKASA